jgi:hypothetical protein
MYNCKHAKGIYTTTTAHAMPCLSQHTTNRQRKAIKTFAAACTQGAAPQTALCVLPLPAACVIMMALKSATSAAVITTSPAPSPAATLALARMNCLQRQQHMQWHKSAAK